MLGSCVESIGQSASFSRLQTFLKWDFELNYLECSCEAIDGVKRCLFSVFYMHLKKIILNLFPKCCVHKPLFSSAGKQCNGNTEVNDTTMKTQHL